MAWLARTLLIGATIAVLAAVFISTMFDDPFVHTLIYSLCVGLSIQMLIEAGRYGGAAWRRHRWPDAGLSARWPGWQWMGPWAVAAAVLGYFGGSLLADWLMGGHRTHHPLGSNLRALSLILMLSLGITLSAVYFFYSRSRLATLRVAAEAAQRNAAEAQLKLLQSQLEPHMLFNTLANLRVLIPTDPPRAQAMLDRLIAFLRATLAASRTASHALADEFERLDDYLALMAVRMGARLQVSLELPAELRTIHVPPLLLQPLVENSIRHGLEPKVGGGRITVRAARDGDALVLSVRDTGVGLTPAEAHASLHPSATDSRFGLQQVRERLVATYGARASFALQPADDTEGGTLAVLRIPFERTR